MDMEIGLTFDDVLLVPQYSEIESRENVDVGIEIKKLGRKSSYFPIMPANMKDISSLALFDKFYHNGSLILLHRFMPLTDQIEFLNQLKEKHGKDILNYFGFSVGIKEEDYQNLEIFIEGCGARIICIDIAHGDSKNCLDMVRYIASHYPEVFIIAGNVCTAEGAERLWKAGADCVKAGIGGSAVCTTRVVSGNGYPQLSMIMNIAKRKRELEIKLNKDIYLISDGGCRIPADFCKALCFSDMVMAGGYFAGCDEAPGEIVEQDGHKYKRYDGSSTLKNRVEGVRSLVPSKGPIDNLIEKVKKGIQSCLSYQGVDNLVELKEGPQLVRLTTAGIIESYPHDVKVIG